MDNQIDSKDLENSYYELTTSIRAIVNSSRLQTKINLDNEWNKLCALLDRIENTTRYLDRLSTYLKEDEFSFYNLLVYGNVVLDCLLELNNMFDNSQDDFKKESIFFTKSIQLSDNSIYLSKLNGQIIGWYTIIKPLIEKYTCDKLYKMQTDEKESLTTVVQNTISELQNSHYEENFHFIGDKNEIVKICNDISLEFINLVEFCNHNYISPSLIEIIELIQSHTMNWYNMSIDRLTKNNNSEKQSDYDYFKFLRSICAVHPIKTTGHEHFLKAGSYCAYVKNSSIICPDADYCATIYSDVGDLTIPLYVNQITNFLKNSISVLTTNVVDAIKRTSIKEILSLKGKKFLHRLKIIMDI